MHSTEDQSVFTVEVHFPGGIRQVPAHQEVGDDEFRTHRALARIVPLRAVPDSMPGWDFYETLTGWYAASARQETPEIG